MATVRHFAAVPGVPTDQAEILKPAQPVEEDRP
jgi:hypothetical protein